MKNWNSPTSDAETISLDASPYNMILKWRKEEKSLHISVPLGLIWAEVASMGLSGSKLCVYDKFILMLFSF